MKDPSKLQNMEATGILEHWSKRQNAKEIPTFEFKAWKNHTGDVLPAAYEGAIDSEEGLYGETEASPVPRQSASKGKVAPRPRTQHRLPVGNRDRTAKGNHSLPSSSTFSTSDMDEENSKEVNILSEVEIVQDKRGSKRQHAMIDEDIPPVKRAKRTKGTKSVAASERSVIMTRSRATRR